MTLQVLLRRGVKQKAMFGRLRVSRLNEVVFDFTGNGFLYNQVRIMVAFLLEIGSNQRPVDDVSRVLEAKDRTLARMTAPASGLYLVNVDYGTNDEKD